MRRQISRVLDAQERAGRLTLTTAQIADLMPGTSSGALRRALLRADYDTYDIDVAAALVRDTYFVHLLKSG